MEGQWRAVEQPEYRYKVVEREARIAQMSWGGYVRHNALYRLVYDAAGTFLKEQFLYTYDAIMMYSPLLPANR